MSPSGIDIDADRDFQEHFWVVVRLGWVAMTLLCVAAALGFTGSGGTFSSQTVRAGASSVELPSVARWSAADTLTVRVPPSSGRSTVLIPASFGDVFSIESVNPQPVSVTAGPDGDLFRFATEPSAGEVSIDFAVRPTRPAWRMHLGPFEVNGAPSDPSTLTVLP